SEDLRWRIIYCQAEGFTQKEIAKRMYVSETTVNKVCRIFKKWGCVRDPFAGRVGRRKIFTRQDMLVLERLVNDKVDWYLDELVYEMEQRIGKVVSIPTLWRSLQFCGITRKK
ncbi:Homeodomain-like protein, partial [Rhizophagus irregularis]